MTENRIPACLPCPWCAQNIASKIMENGGVCPQCETYIDPYDDEDIPRLPDKSKTKPKKSI